MRRLLGNLAVFFLSILVFCSIVFSIELFLEAKIGIERGCGHTLNPQVINYCGLFRRCPLPLKTDPYPRIFCIGGSTTLGMLQMGESYPEILQEIFLRRGKRATVYNCGIQAASATVTNSILKGMLYRYHPSWVIIHDGYNDVPVILQKKGRDVYRYARFDYSDPYIPCSSHFIYMRNPALRFASYFIKINIPVILFRMRQMNLYHDASDNNFRDVREGTAEDVLQENGIRLKVMLEKEIDTIDFCLKNNIKVMVILEPEIEPFYQAPGVMSCFIEPQAAPIAAECHRVQQLLFKVVLTKRYSGNSNVIVLDFRNYFKDNYRNNFFNELHLNKAGNILLATSIYPYLEQLFSEGHTITK